MYSVLSKCIKSTHSATFIPQQPCIYSNYQNHSGPKHEICEGLIVITPFIIVIIKANEGAFWGGFNIFKNS